MKSQIASLTFWIAFAISGHAAVSPEEAKQLGTTLNLLGGEIAGNREGTIPEYTGQGVKLNIDPKTPGYRPDPYANEKPLLSITAQNYTKYADKLDGQVEMFKKYPNFRIDVYPTHRTATLPKYALDNTLKNATQCKTTKNELAVEGCLGGIFFPIPKTGNEVMWNHLMAFEFSSGKFNTRSYIVTTRGASVLVNYSVGTQYRPLFNPKLKTPSPQDQFITKTRLDYLGPTREAGGKLLFTDSLDMVGAGRRVWQYIPGQRRVKLAPDLAYDTPSPTGGGGSTMDDAKIFMGALDRFDFKLVGKKEKFIVYNGFKAADYKECPVEKLQTPYFPNPDCMRYELHRVWKVEATIKPGFRHIYPKRYFFFDEDGGNAGQAENYDAAGKLYRIINTNAFPFGEGNGMQSSEYHAYDLQTGIWAPSGTSNYPGCGFWAADKDPDYYFSPESLAAEGIR